mmetsp:Transcript_75712/g.202526  ORF Transcript_75712/g.202526 Transcript_75712/m.202526 type:complete len:421 (-) Transcript_75712:21-1283(-)
MVVLGDFEAADVQLPAVNPYDVHHIDDQTGPQGQSESSAGGWRTMRDFGGVQLHRADSPALLAAKDAVRLYESSLLPVSGPGSRFSVWDRQASCDLVRIAAQQAAAIRSFDPKCCHERAWPVLAALADSRDTQIPAETTRRVVGVLEDVLVSQLWLESWQRSRIQGWLQKTQEDLYDDAQCCICGSSGGLHGRWDRSRGAYVCGSCWARAIRVPCNGCGQVASDGSEDEDTGEFWCRRCAAEAFGTLPDSSSSSSSSESLHLGESCRRPISVQSQALALARAGLAPYPATSSPPASRSGSATLELAASVAQAGIAPFPADATSRRARPDEAAGNVSSTARLCSRQGTNNSVFPAATQGGLCRRRRCFRTSRVGGSAPRRLRNSLRIGGGHRRTRKHFSSSMPHPRPKSRALPGRSSTLLA